MESEKQSQRQQELVEIVGRDGVAPHRISIPEGEPGLAAYNTAVALSRLEREREAVDALEGALRDPELLDDRLEMRARILLIDCLLALGDTARARASISFAETAASSLQSAPVRWFISLILVATLRTS